MYSEELEMLMDAALADGELTEKEKQILFKRAQAEGVDLDEFEMILDARLIKQKKANQAKAEMPAPQSDKFGEVKKCPACGAIHVVGTAVCPECGYAFSGIAATKSSQLLYEKLLAVPGLVKEEYKNMRRPQLGKSLFSLIGANADDTLLEDIHMDKAIIARKMTVIQDFPVPNNREDLFDFITSLQSKADPKGPRNGRKGLDEHEDLGYAYWHLYCNCINKAKISFANDPDFAPFFAFYESKTIKEEKEEKRGLFGRRK